MAHTHRHYAEYIPDAAVAPVPIVSRPARPLRLRASSTIVLRTPAGTPTTPRPIVVVTRSAQRSARLVVVRNPAATTTARPLVRGTNRRQAGRLIIVRGPAAAVSTTRPLIVVSRRRSQQPRVVVLTGRGVVARNQIVMIV